MTDEARAGEPRTEAGRALLADVRRDESTLAGMAISPKLRFGPQFFEALESAVLAIEAEAATASSVDVDRLRQAIRNAGWRVGIHYPQSVVAEYARLSEKAP